jgi:hypothetical protein
MAVRGGDEQLLASIRVTVAEISVTSTSRLTLLPKGG